MATGAIAEVLTEELAANLEEAAVATRKLNVTGIGYLFGGIVIGAAAGFYLGHRWNKEKIRAEAFKKSEAEVEKIRQFYKETAESVKIAKSKPDLEDVVEERGYSARVDDEELIKTPERPTRPPVPVQEPPVLPRRDFTPGGIAKRHVDREKDKMEGWDYDAEISRRTPTEPYIIHQDEHTENEPEYSQVTYTYYAVDGVLTDEDEEKIRNPDKFVGVSNLGNFGHGADDFHVVYIRNERLSMDFEVCLVAASYEETVQGLSSDGEDN